ncbi:ribonuclease HII [Scenedesmus sp. NREL 46B-D3]|nr:ribonuclease HII [Scenedesmus sp. NREL 46B-D3]
MATAAAVAASAVGEVEKQQARSSNSNSTAVVLPPSRNLAPAREWFSEPCMLGVDEAGRGPVLGAMVYACALAPLSYREELATQAYADSKTLSEAERSRLFSALAADPRCVYVADLLSAELISGQMLGRARVSLNAVAEQSTVGLIQDVLGAGARLREVYIDTVGDPDRYRAKLERAFPGIAFTVCPKADALYPIVSAASIAAKVLRDTSLLVAQGALPVTQAGSLGNGYPSDPVTQAWLAEHCDAVFGFPPLVRFSWETCSRILEERCVKVTWPTDSAGGASHAQQTLACFRQPADNSGESSGMGRHPYFRLRRLQRVTAF